MFLEQKRLTWSLLLVLATPFASGTDKSAADYATITQGSTCNQPGPAGRVHYLVNKNKKKTIVVKLRIKKASSQGNRSEESEELEVRPGHRVELGCDRLGGGVPVVVETDWTVSEVRFK